MSPQLVMTRMSILERPDLARTSFAMSRPIAMIVRTSRYSILVATLALQAMRLDSASSPAAIIASGYTSWINRTQEDWRSRAARAIRNGSIGGFVTTMTTSPFLIDRNADAKSAALVTSAFMARV